MAHSSRARNLTYLGIVRDKGLLLNCKAGSLMKDAVQSYAPLQDEFCVATTGSDGRLEKGLVSKLEVLVYHRGMPDKQVAEFTASLHRAIDNHDCMLVANEFTETKDVTMPGAAFLNGNPQMAFPARVLDSFFLSGNPQLIVEAKIRLIGDLAGMEGRRIMKALKSGWVQARKVMETGRQAWRGETVVHYDLDTGIAYCKNLHANGSEVHLRGFKYGPLRYVQGVLEHDLMVFVKALASGGRRDGAKTFLKELPTPTAEKLDMVSRMENARLSREATSEVIDCYSAFLQLYHDGESLQNQGNPALHFDASEAKERIAVLGRLLENGLFR